MQYSINIQAQVERWGVGQIALRSTQPYANPFTDVRLQVRFTSGHVEIAVDGFYDGHQTWKARLMPPTQGDWSFETTSNDPDLNGHRGAFVVTAPDAHRHGPVAVADTYHFAHADGTSYYPLGTTIYNWLHRHEALQLRTLGTLAHSPFNKVRFLVFPKFMPFNRVDPPVYPYARSSDTCFDFDRFNPEFFSRIETRLRDLQALQIQAEVILFHPYDKWGFSDMSAARDEAYLRYVVARCAAFDNVWWTMANEHDLMQPGSFVGHRFSRAKDWDQLFRVLQAADPYQHLRGMHNCFEWYDHSKPWVTHVVIQEQGKDLYEVALGARHYAKPVVVEEYGYEGNAGPEWGNLSAGEVVNRHWDVAMAGGYAAHGETYVRPGDILWWAAGGELIGDSPARLRFLKDTLAAAPYRDMEPAPDLVEGGTALARRGSYYLFRFTRVDYFKPAQITLDGQEFSQFQVELIDPWQMRTYALGYTRPGTQTLVPHVAPGLLRITGVSQADAHLPTGSIDELFERFGAQP